MSEPASHQPFVSALDAGNFQRAGDWLVRSFASEVYGLCQAIVRDRAMAEDLSQEVFAKAFASLGGYRREASARTWLLTIARNRCIDHIRQQKRWSEVRSDNDPEELADEPTLPPSLVSSRKEIDRALGELEELERALVVLRFRNGLAYDELGAAFGLKTGTVRMRVSRALAKMRASLEAPTTPLKRSIAQEALGERAPSGAPIPAAAAPAPAMAPFAPPPSGAAPSRSRRAAPPPPRPRAPSAPPAQGFSSGGASSDPLHRYFMANAEEMSTGLAARLASMATALPAGS